MQKIKHSIVVVVIIGVIYAIVSYGIFYYKKPSLDQQLQIQNQLSVKNQKESQSVAIQAVVDDQNNQQSDYVCQHQNDEQSDEFIFDDDDQSRSIIAITPTEQQVFIVQQILEKNEEQFVSPDSYSFVTMPAQNCIIDAELFYTLDMLMGEDLDEFVRLVLQSNNNIVSKQACRSCAMYAFFSKIKKHEPLSIEDIKILQPLLANLYRFVQKMYKLSGTQLLRTTQFEALQDLNQSQAAKNDKKLKARRAATAAALKKLQTISYR